VRSKWQASGGQLAVYRNTHTAVLPGGLMPRILLRKRRSFRGAPEERLVSVLRNRRLRVRALAQSRVATRRLFLTVRAGRVARRQPRYGPHVARGSPAAVGLRRLGVRVLVI